jgi:exosortase
MADNAVVNDRTDDETSQLHDDWLQLGVVAYIKVAVVTASLFLLFRTEIMGMVGTWSEDSSWSHGFLIPLFSLYFLSQRKSDILKAETRPNYLGVAALLLCIGAYYYTVKAMGFGYPRQIMLIPTTMAAILLVGGWRMVVCTWLPVLYLVFAIPLPAAIYDRLTIPMRNLASQAGGFVLNLVSGLDATVRGTIIEVVYHGKPLNPPLDVAEACSGMRLLMAFFALGVAMAYLHYRPWWQRVVLLVSTVPIAIGCNVVRVTVTGLIYVLGDPQYAQGFYHDMLGLAMLPLAFGLYGLLAWFMGSLFVEDEEPSGEDVIVRRRDTI